MTEHYIESSRRDEGGAAAEQGSGYGRPPAAHRFRKGQSGNPAGRPRRATGAPGDRLPGADEPTRAMILEEAYRLVAVRDGDAEITIPTHRAVFRSMAEAAMSGNQMAQHRWTKLVQTAEAEQKRHQIALYNALERDHRDREWSDSEGRMEVCVSYADDIIVDSQSGTIVVRDMAGEGEG